MRIPVGPRLNFVRTMLTAFAIIAVALLLDRLARRDDLNDSGEPSLRPPTPVTDDVLSNGDSVVIAQEAMRDVALAGWSVAVDNKVHGYVLAAGSSLQVRAPIGNDLWAVGHRLEINAPVGDNLRLAGRLVNTGSQAAVRGDASIAADAADLAGAITRNLHLTARQATIRGRVGGTVSANVDHLRLASGAVVEGNLLVRGAAAPEIHPDAQVGGITHHRRTHGGWRVVPLLQHWLSVFCAFLVVSSVSYLFDEAWMRRFRSALAAHPLIALTTGLLTVVVLLLAIGLLAASVVGWILAIALLGVLIAGAALGLVLVLLAVGESLARRRPTSLLRKIAAGALVLSLFVSVPTAGPWIFLLIVLFGLGAFIAGHVWTTA